MTPTYSRRHSPGRWPRTVGSAIVGLPAVIAITLVVTPPDILTGPRCQLGAAEAVATSAAPLPAGLPPVPNPADNPPTAEKIHLGQQLYFDPRLSSDRTVSCASCHDPAKGFSNGAAVATGVGGQKGGRSAPTVVNSAYSALQFWDGRAATLEQQALGPIQNPIEMNLPIDEAVARLNAITGYRTQFQQVFGTDATPDGIAKAIAAYERTVLSGNAPYDRFKAGDTGALSESATRGYKLFFGKARCSACHVGANLSDSSFHNLGTTTTDVGREAISGLAGDRGAFKTPTLREIARTAPYMHNGSLATLADVVAYYNKGGNPGELVDEEIFPLNLSATEQADLVQFLTEGFSSPEYPAHSAPALPE
jgi:cytochrome c peroxidase